MAVVCARCGAQNPDGNLYCQSCGAPLMVAPPPAPSLAPPLAPPPSPFAGPPPNIPPPMPGPTGYQSPYYAPAGAVAPVHRTPWMMIIAGVVALVVLMAGFGTAIAVIGNRGSATGGPIGSDIPSPTPGVTPSPIASPTPTSLGATTASNDGVRVKVPQGWAVATNDSEFIVLTDPNGEGSVTVASGPSSPTQTALDNKNTIDSTFKSKYSDTRACPNTSATNGAFNGARGISWTLCFTLTQGAQSAAAAASLFAGANSTGNVYYVVMVVTRQDNLQAYLTEAKPVLQSVEWKLS